jgi:hypothetical protein
MFQPLKVSYVKKLFTTQYRQILGLAIVHSPYQLLQNVCLFPNSPAFDFTILIPATRDQIVVCFSSHDSKERNWYLRRIAVPKTETTASLFFIIGYSNTNVPYIPCANSELET